jgi:hypothetical protein
MHFDSVYGRYSIIRFRNVPFVIDVLLIFIRSRRSCVILLYLHARLSSGSIINGSCSACFAARASLPFLMKKITVSPLYRGMYEVHLAEGATADYLYYLEAVERLSWC